MKAWWFGLQANERRTLMLGGAALLLLLLYFGIWSPLQGSVVDLETQVQEQQAVKRWMQQAAAEVKQLRGSGGRVQAQRDGRSLLALVDQAAKRSRLGSGLKRIEPDGSDAVKVWLEQVPFDDMISWLLNMEKQHALIVSTISIDRQESSGRVSARMTLKGPG